MTSRNRGVGPTYLHEMCQSCISMRRGFGAGAWTVGHVPYREAAAGWRICGVPSEREGEVIGTQGFTLGWYEVPRWGTQNITNSNTNSTAPSRCRASIRFVAVAGSVPPIYTKCASLAYHCGGVLVRAHGPWDTFPTERRRRGG